MKIKGVIKIVKNVPGGIWVQIDTADVSGLFKGFIPLDSPVKFKPESPFEIEIQVEDEPKKPDEPVKTSEPEKPSKPKKAKGNK